MRYHINPETGNPGVCRATVKPCRFGPASSHYETETEARAAFEQQMTRSTLQAVAGGKAKSLRGKIYDNIFPLDTAARKRGNSRSFETEMKTNPNRSVSCPECGSRLGNAATALRLQEWRYKVKCENCSAEVGTGLEKQGIAYPVVELNPDSPTYAAAKPENVSKMIWYHFTTRENWEQDILKDSAPDRVHLGGERAAADRKEVASDWDDSGYLYAVEVVEESSIDPDIHEEQTNDFTVAKGHEPDVVRYKNAFEDTGSISLCAKPSSLRVLGRRKVSEEALNGIGTYFKNSDLEEYMRSGVDSENNSSEKVLVGA